MQVRRLLLQESLAFPLSCRDLLVKAVATLLRNPRTQLHDLLAEGAYGLAPIVARLLIPFDPRLHRFRRVNGTVALQCRQIACKFDTPRISFSQAEHQGIGRLTRLRGVNLYP